MDRFDLQLIELVVLGVAIVTVVVVYGLLELRDRRTVGKAEKDLDRKLKDWADKYAELKGDYLQAESERQQSLKERDALALRLDESLEHRQGMSQLAEQRKLSLIQTQGYLDICKQDCEKLRAELNEVLRERDGLKQQVEERQKQDHEAAKLLYEHGPAFYENKRKQEQEHQELQEKVVTLEKQLQERTNAIAEQALLLKEAHDANQRILDNQVVAAEKYEKRIGECQREIEAKEAEILQLRTDKEHLAKACEEFTDVVQSLSEKLLASEGRVEELVENTEILEEVVKKLQRELEVATNAITDTDRKRNELLEEIKICRKYRNELIEKLRASVTRCEDLERLLKASEENVAMLQQARDERVRDADQEIIRLQAELSDCSQAWRQCGKDRDELILERNAALAAAREGNDEIERLQKELAACNENNRELSVAVSRQKDAATTWRQRCAEQDQQARLMQEEMIRNDVPKEISKEVLAEVKRLEAELSSVMAGNNSLKNQLEDLEAKYDYMSERRDALHREWTNQRARIQDLVGERERMSQEIADLQVSNDKLKKENARLIVDYGKASDGDGMACDGPFKLNIDTKEFKDSLDLTVRRCEELKRAIVEANGGKPMGKRPMPLPNTINAMGPNDRPVTVQHPREWQPEVDEETGEVSAVDSVSPGIDWRSFCIGGQGGKGPVNPMPAPNSVDAMGACSSVDGGSGSAGKTLAYMRGSSDD